MQKCSSYKAHCLDYHEIVSRKQWIVPFSLRILSHDNGESNCYSLTFPSYGIEYNRGMWTSWDQSIWEDIIPVNSTTVIGAKPYTMVPLLAIN